MQLPDGFRYSQACLQDYVDCRRRFYLRYILKLAWPAIETEPSLLHEEHLRQGLQFHQMVYQHRIGIPEDVLGKIAETQPDLQRWWDNYKLHVEDDVPPGGIPELQLSAPAGAARLVAKYDLLVRDDSGRFLIVDWKTSRNSPRRDWVRDRLQTRVYRYLLVRAGLDLHGVDQIDPSDIEMRYWFAEYPEETLRFAYDAVQYDQDVEYLERIMEEIERLAEDDFQRTSNEKRCQYCRYRSLCERGVEAGEGLEEALFFDDLDLETLALDFDQIEAVPF